jgi:hypothetical protein
MEPIRMTYEGFGAIGTLFWFHHARPLDWSTWRQGDPTGGQTTKSRTLSVRTREQHETGYPRPARARRSAWRHRGRFPPNSLTRLAAWRRVLQVR